MVHPFNTILPSAVLALLFSNAGTGMADLASVPFAAPATGARFAFTCSDGPSESVITGSDGMHLHWTRNGEARHNFTPFCWNCDRADFDADAVASIFPLEAGKSVTFTRTRKDRQWQDTITVLGAERVTTPAGSYEAMVVETRSSSNRGWSGRRVAHYAPALNWTVKLEVEDSEQGASSCILDRVS